MKQAELGAMARALEQSDRDIHNRCLARFRVGVRASASKGPGADAPTGDAAVHVMEDTGNCVRPQTDGSSSQSAAETHVIRHEGSVHVHASPVSGSPAKGPPAERDGAAFWDSLAQCIDADTHSVWIGVEKHMERLCAALQARDAARARNKDLEAQHTQLHALLREQMAAPINAELRIPPTLLLAAASTVQKHETKE